MAKGSKKIKKTSTGHWT